MQFADRLARAVRERSSTLVVGLDPVLERLPQELQPRTGTVEREAAAAAILSFNQAVIEQVSPYAVAVKPQVAFYEQWGPPGLAAYEASIQAARGAGLLVIGDVKRGDIGSTALAYARAHLAGDPASRADAITLNPWFGSDGMAPFVETAQEQDAGLFVVVRSSNPSAAELQDWPTQERPLHEHLASLVDAWGAASVGACGYSAVGAVVGATAPAALARLRQLMPRAWFLVPGVGAQGASSRDVAAAFDADGLGALINSSRGILYAYGHPACSGWRQAIGEAARSLRDELREAAAAAAL